MFIHDYIDGFAFNEDLPAYIETWHDSDTDLEVYEFLGLTENEYLHVAVVPENMSNVYEARRQNVPLAEYLENLHK